MPSRKRPTPPEKKRARLDRDHRVRTGESDKAIRKTWPRKKARATRAYRRKVGAVLRDGAQGADPAAIDPDVIQREVVRKWHGSVVSVRDVLTEKVVTRAARLGWNFFRQPYSADRDRARFVRFLEDLMRARKPHTEGAIAVQAWLSRRPVVSWHQRSVPWLAAFFADEPELRVRLEKWLSAAG